MLAQVGGAKALRELPEQQSMQERVHARIGKAQARSPLAAGHDRTIDALEGILAEDAIVAQALDFEQTTVGCKADGAQLGEIDQAPADTEVVGVVDRRLGA